MKFFLNGKKVEYAGDPEISLLKYLRDFEGIISPKDGCSGQGVCGCCTVIMDDKAVLSCKTAMKRVDGAHVFTTEGLKENVQHAFSSAFVEKGGIQCGFCTPGIVMRSKALLDKNSSPSREDIVSELNKHICRCTGYKKIVDSVERVAEILKGDESSSGKKLDGKIGSRYPKYDSHSTVLGQRPFVCDIRENEMLFGALKFSDHPRAKVKSIKTEKAEKQKGVIKVLTADDISGDRITGLIKKDWPVMVKIGEETRYIGDVLALVVAENSDVARQAVKMLEVEYDVLSPVCDPVQALKNDSPKIHSSGNILSVSEVKRGNVEKTLAGSAFVSRGVYKTQTIEHAFMEPECCFSKPWKNNGKDGVQIFSQGQGAYEDRKAVAAILGLPVEQVNAIQVPNGGGFGGKEDLSVQAHTALAAFILKKPVRVCLTREMAMTDE